MRKDPAPFDRPTAEELDAVRRRFAGHGGRTDGAATLDDLAEALGVPSEEVQRQLDLLREERAVRPKARNDQRAMLLFAIFLLACAFEIHRLHPRALTDDERFAQAQERLAEMRARRKAHPVIHYPILTKLKSGSLPPQGFALELRGPLTTTTLEAMHNPPMARGDTVAALSAALANAYRASMDAEAKAPLPPSPIERKENWMSPFPPGAIAYTASSNNGVTNGYFEPSRLAAMSPTEREKAINGEAQRVAQGLVDGALQSQEQSLRIEPMHRANPVGPPSGFSLQFKGRQDLGSAASAILVLPIDKARVARKLEWAMRDLVWRDMVPPDYSTPETRAALAKRATTGFAEVTVRGPLAQLDFQLPLFASTRYPTAADAVRAADRIMADQARKAAAQIDALGAGGVKR